MDFEKEVNKSIAQITRQLKIKDAIHGKLQCPKCRSKLRYTIHGEYFCPRCVKIVK
jgi:Zn finger protein HypA/HybF involved in hydrogenase expression